MLQIAASALPANAPGAVAANPATQIPSAYGAASAAPTVPVQLPSAVVASGALAAYQPNTPQIAKPQVRLASASQPSSQLAAQYLAQTPDASAEDVQLFAPVVTAPAPTTDPESLAYLKDLRVANGEALPPEQEAASTNTQNTNTATAASASARPSSAATPSNLPLVAPISSGAAQLASQALVLKAPPPIQARPAPAPLAPAGKKPGIGNARETDAYKVAESRNFAISFPTSVAAVF